jgi:hypothetical protein
MAPLPLGSLPEPPRRGRLDPRVREDDERAAIELRFQPWVHRHSDLEHITTSREGAEMRIGVHKVLMNNSSDVSALERNRA